MMKKILYGAMLATTAIFISPIVHAQVALSINIGPPPLPIYAQPPIPGDGYMWTPGYWSWNTDENDYYWVPGTWVLAPFEGALWTPGYWGWGDGSYAWHRGYWGSHIGYYGGINYGFGYTGVGYQGGYWNGGAFSYNRSVNNVGSGRIAHIYNSRIDNSSSSRVSFNGGNGGIRMQPTRGEESIANMPHNSQTAPQAQHEQSARSNPVLRASTNHGMPQVAATPAPGAFAAPNVEAARPSREQPGNRSHDGSPRISQMMPAQRHEPNQQSSVPAVSQPQKSERHAQPENMREQAHPPQQHQEAPHAASRAAPQHEESSHEK
jgi:hypothetical protein